MLRNQSRLEKLMSLNGVDALIGTTAQNVRYLTDYESPNLYIHRYHGSFGVAVRDREPVLITTLAGLEYMIGRPAATTDIRATGTYVVKIRPGAKLDPAANETKRLRESSPHYPTADDAIVATARELVDAGGVIGIDQEGIAPSAWRTLISKLKGYRVEEAADLFKQIRAIKSEDEIALLRRAASINEHAAAAGFGVCSKGASEREMEAVFRAEAARLGADPVHWETTIGLRSSGSYYASNYVGQQGEIIRSDSSVRYRMYWGDTGRTRAIGKVPAEHQSTYNALLTGQLALLGAARSEMCIGDLFELAIQTVRNAGIVNYDRHHVGHAIGLEMYEPPILRRGSDDRLEAGMVINLELPYYELGYGGFQIEDTVLVTESGCEVLTASDRAITSV